MVYSTTCLGPENLKEKYAKALLQGGKDAVDAFGCRSLFAKKPLLIGLFCRKMKWRIQ